MFNIFVGGLSIPCTSTHTNILDMLIEQSDSSDYHYECKQGHCGSCRMKVTSGQYEYISKPLAFLRDNEVLLCIAKPLSDISLER